MVLEPQVHLATNIMSTRSGRSYNNDWLSQAQRDELLVDTANQVTALSQRLETVWNRLFPVQQNQNEEHGEAGNQVNVEDH